VGYWIIEATEDRAIEFAARVVAFIEGPVEVRQDRPSRSS